MFVIKRLEFDPASNCIKVNGLKNCCIHSDHFEVACQIENSSALFTIRCEDGQNVVSVRIVENMSNILLEPGSNDTNIESLVSESNVIEGFLIERNGKRFILSVTKQMLVSESITQWEVSVSTVLDGNNEQSIVSILIEERN